nr:PREDICTED: galactosylgalactosylxylosylprotein 3-beta-glucuronosyltransferase P-like isoform X1 [Bemisia tabaci]
MNVRNRGSDCQGICRGAAARRMLLLMVLGAFLVFTQYHLSVRWVAQPQQAMTLDPDSGSLDNFLRASVARIQFDDNLISIIGEKMVKEMALQLGRQIVLSNEIRGCMETDPNLPMLYIITPTYRRPEQIAELTRLAQTLMHVKNIHWLVIEDATQKTWQVTQLLERTGIKFEHLIAPMPEDLKKKKGLKPRGVSNREKGINWVRNHTTDGVLYFADDDNTYDIQIFHEMRFTKKVSMWPVGLCTGYGVSSPIVKNGVFQGFYDGWVAGRKFPVDMAGFAVNIKFLLQRPAAKMPYKPGFEEDGFLQSLAPFEPKEIELRADNCTKIYVWHTQTKKNSPAGPLDAKYNSTNLLHLKRFIV